MTDQWRNSPQDSNIAPEYKPKSLHYQLDTNNEAQANDHSNISHNIPTSATMAAFTPTESDFEELLGTRKDWPQQSKRLKMAKMDNSPVDAEQLTVDIVPIGIVFTNEKDDDLMSISKNLLKKLPMSALNKIMKLSKESLGGTCYLGATPYYESLVRLEQYLRNGDYAPFDPAIPLQYIDISGTAREWTRKQQNHAIKVTDETARLFRSEVHLYLFAAEFGFTSLRELSAKRLESQYPPSLKGIFRLISSVYNVAERNKDRGLCHRIIELLDANSGDLTRMPDFITLIKELFSRRDPFSMVLVETLSRAYQTAKAELNEYMVKQAMKPQSALPQPALPSPALPSPALSSPALPQSALPQLPPNTPIRPANFQLELEASHTLDLLTKLVKRGSLVVALSSGYGTLLRGGIFEGRNRDFVFEAGEFLLISRDESQSSKNNIVVVNSKGETGDILGNMVEKASLSLGVTVIKEESLPGFKHAPAADYPHHLDREQRTSVLHELRNRRRSRSPVRGPQLTNRPA